MDDSIFQRGNLSLSSIEHFVASVEDGSMSAAALRLGISPALVSKSIARLEKRTGVRLLHRTTRYFALTTPGLAFYERACHIIDGLRQAEALVMWESPAQKCSLCILTSDFLAVGVLWPCLRKLQVLYPGISIEIRTGDFDVAQYSSGSANIKVWTGPSEERAGAIRLAHWPNFFVASKQYLEDNGFPTDLDHLTDHVFVAGLEDAWTIQGPEGLKTVRHKAVFRSNAPDLIQEAIRAGLGIGLTTPLGLERELASGQVLRVLHSHASPMSEGLWAETPARGCHPAHDLVLDSIRDALNEKLLVDLPRNQWAA
ncbi:transcriptional regulator, LysR family [Rhodomicrobium vannielii ATCC 17100]|uniref:Transcriptional regulator, LysR family n=1 Tax=Rhodomicrobium vannielii (strain ATCC 17100 / DSM 162 / LMG 4299 / NCIMB 10020 / ATH 3.1.1) TaxID=648757 RepID=E3I1K8_RHOVT|nr:LysR family transcriptional regulator [Rhodomicrobium vannielii]ADP72383.1 transcriptional regulator, LysR family [Rhodomicrobium vannielii ATCC 17100]